MRAVIVMLVGLGCSDPPPEPDPDVEVDACRVPRRICVGPLTVSVQDGVPSGCPDDRVRRPGDFAGCTDLIGPGDDGRVSEWLSDVSGGDLCLVGDEALEAARNLRTVRSGELTVVGTGAADLQALRCLRDAGAVTVRGNDALVTTDGLHGLERTLELTLAENPRLERVVAFEALEVLSEWLRLDDLPALETVEPFPPLEDRPLHFRLSGLPALQDLEGMRLWSPNGAQVYQIGQVGTARDLTPLRLPEEASATWVYVGDTLYESLDGLGARDISYLEIVSNPRLRDLSALSMLEGPGSVDIRRTESLETLVGPAGLVGSEDAVFLFQTHAVLTRLEGFEGVTEARVLEVGDAPRLQTLGGFGALEVALSVRLTGLPALATWRGLPSLTRLRSLEISQAASLRTLDGCLPELREVQKLIIRDTPELDVCSVQRLLDQLDAPPATLDVPDRSGCGS